MPSLPDIPGRNLVTGTGRHAGKVAAGAGLAVIAIGGYLVRRLIRRGGGDEGAVSADRSAPIADPTAVSADPIAEPPTAPPAPESPNDAPPPAPEPAPAPEPIEPADAPDAPPPTTEAPPTATGTDAPPQPGSEPGDISKDNDPHHALNNPVGEPDPTEWPDPYEKREDPRDPADPADPDGLPFGEEPHSPTNAESTSEPHPSDDPEAGDRAAPPKRDNLDD